MIIFYLIFSYTIMFSAILSMIKKSKIERLFMFILAPVSLPIFLGYFIAPLLDKIDTYE